MRLDDLRSIRISGKRPVAGLLFLAEAGIAKHDAIIITRDRTPADFSPLNRLVVVLQIKAWAPWVLDLIDRIEAVKPAALVVHDRACGDHIAVLSNGERLPISCKHYPRLAHAIARRSA